MLQKANVSKFELLSSIYMYCGTRSSMYISVHMTKIWETWIRGKAGGKDWVFLAKLKFTCTYNNSCYKCDSISLQYSQGPQSLYLAFWT